MSDELKNYLVESLKNQLSDYRSQSQVENVGYVVELGDGVAKVNGLSQAMSLEMVAFPNDIFGVVLNLEEDLAGVIILGDYRQIKEGDMVKTTGRVLEVPVGEELIGRVINPLGVPLDEKGSLKLKNFYPVEKIAPRVIEREPVKISLQTGIKAIDAIIPIGRGQRELIIGDRQTGKTALAIDAIVNQKDQNVICVYVAIGQKDSSVAKTVAKLTELGALDHTIVVVASASESAALNYIAPFAGSAMAEYFKDQGKDVLIVYDDLSKHAVSYRQLSLLLRRPPGREAYP
ncbi:MAG: F0F1 ATP synthase subunit alpha, partial [Candidatus Gribaldobacteria bacterium]|nr:F0F1 ATP synthase subunit alpha [Candidatus Gribaldobacteria bacterium]